jgi:DegV family protein with EDD domain
MGNLVEKPRPNRRKQQMSIEILVDSASGLTQKEAAEKGLLFVPLAVTIGSNTYTEGVDITPDEFYSLIGKGNFPRTSQPAPQAYLDAYNSAKEKGDEVLVLALSSKVSGAYQSANIAAEMSGYGEHIRIIDTLAFFAGTRILLKETLEKRDQLSLKELGDDLDALKLRLRVYAGMDTLEYVYKGGRLSKLSYALGVFLHAKAIGTLDNGTVTLAGKALGTKNAMKFIIDKVADEPIDFSYPCYPLYSSDKTILERFFTEYVLPAYPNASFAEPLQIDPVIGTHIGPLVYGLFYVRKPYENEPKKNLLVKAQEAIQEKINAIKKK